MFRTGDIVKERTAEKRPIIGRVLSFGSSTGHDYYKILSRGEVYSARDDELELVRRAPSKYEKQGLVDQFLLNWYGPEQKPADGEECLVIILCGGEREIVHMVQKGGMFVFEGYTDMGARYDIPLSVLAKRVLAWAPWDWPEIGKEDGDDDS